MEDEEKKCNVALGIAMGLVPASVVEATAVKDRTIVMLAKEINSELISQGRQIENVNLDECREIIDQTLAATVNIH